MCKELQATPLEEQPRSNLVWRFAHAWISSFIVVMFYSLIKNITSVFPRTVNAALHLNEIVDSLLSHNWFMDIASQMPFLCFPCSTASKLAKPLYRNWRLAYPPPVTGATPVKLSVLAWHTCSLVWGKRGNIYNQKSKKFFKQWDLDFRQVDQSSSSILAGDRWFLPVGMTSVTSRFYELN